MSLFFKLISQLSSHFNLTVNTQLPLDCNYANKVVIVQLGFLEIRQTSLHVAIINMYV